MLPAVNPPHPHPSQCMGKPIQLLLEIKFLSLRQPTLCNLNPYFLPARAVVMQDLQRVTLITTETKLLVFIIPLCNRVDDFSSQETWHATRHSKLLGDLEIDELNKKKTHSSTDTHKYSMHRFRYCSIKPTKIPLVTTSTQMNPEWLLVCKNWAWRRTWRIKNPGNQTPQQSRAPWIRLETDCMGLCVQGETWWQMGMDAAEWIM